MKRQWSGALCGLGLWLVASAGACAMEGKQSHGSKNAISDQASAGVLTSYKMNKGVSGNKTGAKGITDRGASGNTSPSRR